MAWFVQLNGKIFGPLQDDQLRQLASAGKIFRDTEVSQQREGPWFAASRIKNLFPGQAPTAPPPATVEQPGFEDSHDDFDDPPSASRANASAPPALQRSNAHESHGPAAGGNSLEIATLARIDQSIGEAVSLLKNLRQAVPQQGLRNVSDYGVGDWIGIIFRAAIALIILQILLIVVGIMIFAFFAQALRS
jgi:hypothetical protein